jgi:hypothetical protein
MAGKEKIYILKHTPEGFTLTPEREPDRVIADEGANDLLDMNTLTPPRWGHWYQRKLARPWQATLLGMNIEPLPKTWRILRAHDPARYQTYLDRKDILEALVGYEIAYFEDHVREAAGANGKYIELAEYCRYAESLGWSDMEAMHNGLRLDVDPPSLNLTTRHQNNVMAVLDAVLLSAVKDYKDGKSGRSPAAVLNWLKKNGEESIVAEPTLRNWFKQMGDLEEKRREQR